MELNERQNQDIAWIVEQIYSQDGSKEYTTSLISSLVRNLDAYAGMVDTYGKMIEVYDELVKAGVKTQREMLRALNVRHFDTRDTFIIPEQEIRKEGR